MLSRRMRQWSLFAEKIKRYFKCLFPRVQCTRRTTIFLLSLFRSLPTGFFIPCFYPQNLKHLQQYHRPDREQTENGKFSIFRCVFHNSPANSLFGQVAGPFQEIILQLHRPPSRNGLRLFRGCLLRRRRGGLRVT